MKMFNVFDSEENAYRWRDMVASLGYSTCVDYKPEVGFIVEVF